MRILKILNFKALRYNVTIMKRICYGEKELELEQELEKELEPDETKLNQTKLNLIFNYIYNSEQKSFQELNQSEEEMKENARIFLVKNTLKKLEILIEDIRSFELMNNERKLDILIQYYVIDEFSKSPYNFLLYKLNKENFYLKYKKAEKYIPKENIQEFVGYLITCLQEELMK